MFKAAKYSRYWPSDEALSSLGFLAPQNEYFLLGELMEKSKSICAASRASVMKELRKDEGGI
jgi:hypothetical protein